MVDSLFGAGCDDATVDCSDGVQHVDFDREAATFGEALLSAVDDLESLKGVQVMRNAALELRHGRQLIDSSADVTLRELLGASLP